MLKDVRLVRTRILTKIIMSKMMLTSGRKL
jgi:hypothetical protein